MLGRGRRRERAASQLTHTFHGLPFMLSALPEELLHHVYRAVLEIDVVCAVHIRRVCAAWHASLEHMCHSTERCFRLAWPLELAAQHSVSNAGTTLTNRTGFNNTPWAAGTLLPTAGRSSFRVRIELSKYDRGEAFIGVCDGDVRCGWGLDTSDGKIYVRSRRSKLALQHAQPPAPVLSACAERLHSILD